MAALLDFEPVRQGVDLGVDDRTALGTMLLKSMQDTMYSNRMLIPPRRLREVAQGEVAALADYLAAPNADSAVERGRRLMREGLGQRAVVGLTSTLRVAGREIAASQSNGLDVVALLEEYTSAMIGGYMAAYEEDQRAEQQRTMDAYVRLTKAAQM